jgi:hypothetical protein
MNQILFSGVFALVLFGSNIVKSAPDIPPEARIMPVASTSIDIWVYELSKCESGGNWNALNPKDLDGTPSKGKFQFKDQTFNYFSEKYNIATTSIWNGDEQELIVRQMIASGVDLSRQFPACVKKLGLPWKN